MLSSPTTARRGNFISFLGMIVAVTTTLLIVDYNLRSIIFIASGIFSGSIIGLIFAEKLYFLDGVLSLFRDSQFTCFPFLNYEDHPLNEYGDIKDAPSISNPTGSGYNYLELATARKTGSDFYIQNCVASKMKESVSNE